MKFNLVDKIEHLSSERISTIKCVSLAEEYLADHFPTFPVLPGVMMLESATQAAAWLFHHRTDFSRAICVLREARNVRYGQFVAPGNYLKMDVELIKLTDHGATFKAIGTVGAAQPPACDAARIEPRQGVQMRLELSCFNLADKNPSMAPTDERLRQHNRLRWDVLRGSNPPATTDVSLQPQRA